MQFPIFGRLLLIVLAGMLPGAAMLAYNEFILRQTRVAEVREQAARGTAQAAGELARIMGSARTVLIAASASAELRTGAARECNAYLASLNRQLLFLSDIAVVDRAKTIICGDSRVTNLNTAGAVAVDLALKANDLAVGVYREVGPERRKVLPIAMPFDREGGGEQQVLAIFIDLEWLQQRVQERGRTPGGSITVADRDGTIVARDPDPARFVGTKIPSSFDNLVRGEAPGVVEVLSQDGVTRILGYHPATMALGLYVSSGFSRDEAFRAIDRATRWAFLSVALGIVLSLVMGWLVGEQFVRRPVRLILRTIDEWRANRTEPRTGMDPDHGEIEAVGHALDELMDESTRRQQAREAAERERDLLTRELGHRIKNMLAIIQALARQSFRGAADDTMIQQFNLRMKALANTYGVLLATDIAPADIHEVVSATLAPHIEPGSINVAVDGPRVHLSARANIALTLVLHELCTNAVKYGALSNAHGQVDIRWTMRPTEEGQRVHLEWTETGGPPVPENRSRGFGTALIDRAFPAELHAGVGIEFRPSGVHCVVDFLASADGVSTIEALA